MSHDTGIDLQGAGGGLPPPSTLVDLLRQRALHQPARLAYTFLHDDGSEEVDLTYQELDRRTRAIAARLQAGTSPGERALLLYPQSAEYIAAFFGCLYARLVAVPAYPPRPNRTLERLRAILLDAQPSVALTTTAILARIEPLFEQTPELKKLQWIATDELSLSHAGEWREPSVSAETTAFLQYTSGSTAAPKGVIVSHRNLLHNQRMIERAFKHTEESVVVGWLPLYHDMGLIGNVLQPLYMGARCILMSPTAFLQRPSMWLEAISRYRATTSGGPNFAYDLCVRRIKTERRAALDLSSWRVAFNGAEPVRAETLARFGEAFAPSGFRPEAWHPCYGLAEATLMVTGGTKPAPLIVKARAEELENNRIVESEDENSRALTGCGTALLDQRIVIVHPEVLTVCAPDEVGEIWVAGDSVAVGYWRQPEATRSTFRAFLPATGEGPFLRTGDLGFIKNGELFVTGRLKDLLIIRGRNHYPQDIELTVEQSHPSLRQGCGAAFSVEIAGEERLVVVQELEPRQQADPKAIIESIRQSIAAEHEIETQAVVLLKAGGIFKTSSGKIQRRVCRAHFLEGSLAAIEQWHAAAPAPPGEAAPDTPFDSSPDATDIEGWLRRQLAAKLKVDPSEIDAERPLAAYGLDSLAAVELAHDLQTSFGLNLSMVSFLQGQSINQLARESRSNPPAAADTLNSIVASGSMRKGETTGRLSRGQQSLWFLYQLAPTSVAYNLTFAARIRADVESQCLERALQALVERHPALRSSFSDAPGGPIRLTGEQSEVCLRAEDVSALSEAEAVERLSELARQPFELEHGQLLRVHLLQRPARDSLLLLSIHHIVADFWSLAVLMEELGDLYDAERTRQPAALSPVAATYADYVQWQEALIASPEGERHWNYWREQLAGELPVLNLPTDHPRPPLQTYRGATRAFALSAELSGRLLSLGQSHGATLYMTLLAAFQTLLLRYTGQRDMTVGSAMAGRSRAEFAGIVGYLVNSVTLRADLSGDPAFGTFLERTRQTVLAAFEHQEYPFSLLVERLQPERDPSRSPLFQTMFNLQRTPHLGDEQLAAFALGLEGARVRLGQLVLESIVLPQKVAQFDLSLTMAEVDGALQGTLEYNTDLFDASTIERLHQHFINLLESLSVHPGERLSQVSLLSEHERRQMLVDWNNTRTEYSVNGLVTRLFEEQAARRPAAIAVVSGAQELSYAELNGRANQLAHYLRARGVGPESRVGISMERSVEMMVAVLGVLKAGAAYVPLDPAYPRERLSFMLADARVELLLTQHHLLARWPECGAAVICVDSESEHLARVSMENVESGAEGQNLAYLIYTSGSTGQPKGVMIPHGALVNHCHALSSLLALSPADRVLQFASLSFDVAAEEIFPTWASGATLVLLPGDALGSLTDFGRMIAEARLSVLNLPTSFCERWLWEMESEGGSWPRSVRLMMVGSEATSWASFTRWRAMTGSGVKWLSAYGPTETTITATMYEAGVEGMSEGSAGQGGAGGKYVPLGRGVGNVRVYVLDEWQEMVGIGMVGELCIGGAGVGRGYVGGAGRTAERYVPDRYSGESGGRMYRSGDLVRYGAGGELEYVGRVDEQVKVRGYRIELGEIEAVLGRHPSVAANAVLAREDVAGDKRLVAYFVAQPTHDPAIDELRNYLRKSLPEYMIPSVLMRLEELPLTRNGKIDRAALPAPDRTQREMHEPYVAPRNGMEELVASMWSELLGAERVGVEDNFYALGGHSLLATQVISRVRDQFQVEVALASLLERPTVAGLCEAITRAQNSRAGLSTRAVTPVSRQLRRVQVSAQGTLTNSEVSDKD